MAVDPARLATIQGIVSTPKTWAAASGMSNLWQKGNKRHAPKPWTFRAALEHGGATLEGVFVEVFYQPSKLAAVRATLQMTLVVDAVRAIGIDDNGPASGHLNKFGVGFPYYKQTVGVPHVHFCVPDALTGYAEPIQQASQDDLWISFLQRANVLGAPQFELPPGQLEMTI